MKKALLALTIVAMLSGHAFAADKYWDPINGSTGGTGSATPGGAWDTTSSFWNPLSDGTGTVTTFANGDDVFFAAGGDAIGSYAITGTVTASGAGGSLTVQEGTIDLTGTVTMGGNPIVVESGAILNTNSSLRISTSAGSTYTLNNGTLRTTNPSNAGSFVDIDSDIILNGGGTIDYAVVNLLSIVQTTTSITGTGPLTKTGVGVIGIASTVGTNTYTGGTIINNGELRIRTVPNTLPITTAVTVTGPGVLNLNNVSQQIGSLTGTGNVGTGGATLTIDGAASTSFDGALKNLANAGAGAVASGSGRLIKLGAGTITFNGLNDITGSTTLTAGGITVSATGSLGGDTMDLTVTAGTLTLQNAVEHVENLGGAGGTIDLANAALSLITDPTNTATAAQTTYSGTITGAGGLTKQNEIATTTVKTLTLSGANTYAGNTIIEGGIISVQNATALGTTAGYTEVNATGVNSHGAELLFTGVATNFTVNEPLRIKGNGAATNEGAIAVVASATPTISGPVTLIGDATVTVAGSSSVTYNNAASFTSVANENLTLAGGSGAGAGGLISGVIALNGGGITKNQGGKWVLSGNNTYNGTTTVNAGTLLVNGNNSGSGAVNVLGGKLGGTGTIAGPVNVTGGTLAAGASIGTLNLGSSLTLTSGTFEWEFNTTLLSADLTNVSGALAIASATALSVLPDLGPAFLATGTKFTLISYASGAPPGTFAGLSENAEFVMAGKRWRIKYADTAGINGGLFPTAGHNVTLTAIPEASSILVMGLGGIFAIGAVWLGKRYGVAIKI